MMRASPEMDVDFISEETYLPTPAFRYFHFLLDAFTTSQPTRITQSMILKMGNLSHTADVMATGLEVVVP